MKKVVILGSESTGKSVLAAALASIFKCEWVPEFARQYIEQLKRPYEFSDLLKIAEGQRRLEDELKALSKRLLICDTNAEIIKVWSENAYGYCSELVLRQIANQQYDLILLADIDLPWSADPQREHPNPAERHHFFSIYKDIAVHSGLPFGIVQGLGAQRTACAVAIIKKYTDIEPVY